MHPPITSVGEEVEERVGSCSVIQVLGLEILRSRIPKPTPRALKIQSKEKWPLRLINPASPILTPKPNLHIVVFSGCFVLKKTQNKKPPRPPPPKKKERPPRREFGVTNSCAGSVSLRSSRDMRLGVGYADCIPASEDKTCDNGATWRSFEMVWAREARQQTTAGTPVALSETLGKPSKNHNFDARRVRFLNLSHSSDVFTTSFTLV